MAMSASGSTNIKTHGVDKELESPTEELGEIGKKQNVFSLPVAILDKITSFLPIEQRRKLSLVNRYFLKRFKSVESMELSQTMKGKSVHYDKFVNQLDEWVENKALQFRERISDNALKFNQVYPLCSISLGEQLFEERVGSWSSPNSRYLVVSHPAAWVDTLAEGNPKAVFLKDVDGRQLDSVHECHFTHDSQVMLIEYPAGNNEDRNKVIFVHSITDEWVRVKTLEIPCFPDLPVVLDHRLVNQALSKCDTVGAKDNIYLETNDGFEKIMDGNCHNEMVGHICIRFNGTSLVRLSPDKKLLFIACVREDQSGDRGKTSRFYRREGDVWTSFELHKYDYSYNTKNCLFSSDSNVIFVKNRDSHYMPNYSAYSWNRDAWKRMYWVELYLEKLPARIDREFMLNLLPPPGPELKLNKKDKWVNEYRNWEDENIRVYVKTSDGGGVILDSLNKNSKRKAFESVFLDFGSDSCVKVKISPDKQLLLVGKDDCDQNPDERYLSGMTMIYSLGENGCKSIMNKPMEYVIKPGYLVPKTEWFFSPQGNGMVLRGPQAWTRGGYRLFISDSDRGTWRAWQEECSASRDNLHFSEDCYSLLSKKYSKEKRGYEPDGFFVYSGKSEQTDAQKEWKKVNLPDHLKHVHLFLDERVFIGNDKEENIYIMFYDEDKSEWVRLLADMEIDKIANKLPQKIARLGTNTFKFLVKCQDDKRSAIYLFKNEEGAWLTSDTEPFPCYDSLHPFSTFHRLFDGHYGDSNFDYIGEARKFSSPKPLHRFPAGVMHTQTTQDGAICWWLNQEGCWYMQKLLGENIPEPKPEPKKYDLSNA